MKHKLIMGFIRRAVAKAKFLIEARLIKICMLK